MPKIHFSDDKIRGQCTFVFSLISRISKEYAQAIIDADAVPSLVRVMYIDDKDEENTAINDVILTFLDMCKHGNGFEMFNVLYDAGVIDGLVMILIRANQCPPSREILCELVEVSCELTEYCKDFGRIKSLVEAIVELVGKFENLCELCIDLIVCDFIKDIIVRFFYFIHARLASEMLTILRKTLQDTGEDDGCGVYAGINAVYGIVFVKYVDPRLTNLQWLRWAFQTELLATVVALMKHEDEYIADLAVRIVKVFTVRLRYYLYFDICYPGSNV